MFFMLDSTCFLPELSGLGCNSLGQQHILSLWNFPSKQTTQTTYKFVEFNVSHKKELLLSII